jgi:hypothetical protein
MIAISQLGGKLSVECLYDTCYENEVRSLGEGY